MRAWVALTWKGVPFEERTILLTQDKTRAERRKVSPTGKLPVLHHGGLVVPDSLAIIEYLEEILPASVLPGSLARRPRAARASPMAGRSHALGVHEDPRRDVVQPLLPAAGSRGHPRRRWPKPKRSWRLWEMTLTRPERRGGPYLCGAFCARRRDVRHDGRTPACLRRSHVRLPAGPRVHRRRSRGAAGESVDGSGPRDAAEGGVLNRRPDLKRRIDAIFFAARQFVASKGPFSRKTAS